MSLVNIFQKAINRKFLKWKRFHCEIMLLREFERKFSSLQKVSAKSIIVSFEFPHTIWNEENNFFLKKLPIVIVSDVWKSHKKYFHNWFFLVITSETITIGNFFRKKLFSSFQIVWGNSKETIDFALTFCNEEHQKLVKF